MNICTIPDCSRAHRARGLCDMHYKRARQQGMQPRTALDRFWAKVEKTPTCWLWVARLSHEGYGQFYFARKHFLAHRWSFETFAGPIPAGFEIDHLCRVRNCVNPDHLEPVTGAENLRRSAAARTHCPHGHEFSGDNLGIRPNGNRWCRACDRERQRRRARARRLEAAS